MVRRWRTRLSIVVEQPRLFKGLQCQRRICHITELNCCQQIICVLSTWYCSVMHIICNLVVKSHSVIEAYLILYEKWKDGIKSKYSSLHSKIFFIKQHKIKLYHTKDYKYINISNNNIFFFLFKVCLDPPHTFSHLIYVITHKTYTVFLLYFICTKKMVN